VAESVYKVIELVGTSTDSWEKAASAAVEKAASSLRDLRIAEVAELDLQIENGVVKNLNYDRYWAQKKGVSPTASGGSLKMSGGSSTMEEMIASTPRGLLVTRFWYLRPVDQRTILYTGRTRDGTFLIENGKITRAVKNLRFNDSPVFMLNNLESLGVPTRVSASEDGGPGQAVVVPPIKVRDFNFTSLSDAV
jgi:predicted Zn-dependent protease